MSGLFGILSDDPTTILPFLEKVSNRLVHQSWHITDTWRSDEQPVGLGRVGIDIFNRESQPVTGAGGQLVGLFCGEIVNRVDLAKQLGIELAEQSALPDAMLVLHAYQHFGQFFAAELEGTFFIAIYDTAARQLILTNDRFGLYPHYYTFKEEKLVFAPQVKGVLAAPFVRPVPDGTAIAQYMRFQHLLGDRTFHEDIAQFPRGSVGVFQEGRWTLSRYWDWDQVPDNSQMVLDEAAEEAGRLLRQTMSRLSSGPLRPGVFLSGGLDSRTIVGMMPEREPPPVTASFGARGSRDVYYAERIAGAVGSRHHWFDLPEDGSWVHEYIDRHFALTEGFHSWIHMHGISMLPDLRQMIDYNLTGWDGGTLMGDSDLLNPLYNTPANFTSMLTTSFHDFNQAFTWPGITEAEERLLYAPAAANQMIGRAFESFREALTPYQKYRQEAAHEFFYLDNHCLRLTINMVTFARSHIEVRTPFWDYPLVDFMLSLRPDLRTGKQLYRHVLTRELPNLARIPYDKDEFLPIANDTLRRSHGLGVRVLRRLKVLPQRPTLYADYENYLRRALRPWAESLLHDPRLAERGLFDANYVRDLLDRHIAGRELWTIGKVAPLLTLEMVMRTFFD
jgi:asparagine synthase (glutamine-hydrolysing)